MDGHDDGCSTGPAQPVCWFCGEPELTGDIGDIWVDGHFQLDTCCQGLLDSVAAGMNDDPAWGRELLRRLGAEEITGQRLRRVSDGEGGHPMLDYKLQVRPVSFRDAARFVEQHHTHCRPPLTWRFGHGVSNGGWRLMGVVMVGNPVARAFMGRNLVEVTRLCVRRDTEPMLRDGCCSKLYAAAARSAERAGFSRIISYTTAEEDGASVRAAGWVIREADGARARLAQRPPAAQQWQQCLRRQGALVAHAPAQAARTGQLDTTRTRSGPGLEQAGGQGAAITVRHSNRLTAWAA